jgi:hypothetical protein
MKKIFQRIGKLVCGTFYHRFGYKSEYCVRCGTPFKETCGDGVIIDSDYDEVNY